VFFFQDIISALSSFWARQGCAIVTPYDLEKGAGTSNPMTLLKALGPEPFSAAYIEPCRRPKDSRYAQNPNRMQHYFQYQVILKPSPDNIVDLYLASLDAIGLRRNEHDIRFVHDDWENPTLGAWGLGWEIWLDGMEVSQFTFFQAVAGIPLSSIVGEITYGTERLAMCLQGVDSFFSLRWNEQLTYKDLFYHEEVQWSAYNFEEQDSSMWMRHFDDYTKEAKHLVKAHLPIPAYDFVVKASHAFNMLDAKGVISVSERASYISMIRAIAQEVAEEYLRFRESIGFPMQVHYQEPLPLPSPSAPIPKDQESRFVLEIGMEELPSGFVNAGIRELSKKFEKLLASLELSYSSMTCYGSPRRLAVVVDKLVTRRPATSSQKRGPLVELMWDHSGVLTEVGQGFLRTVGIPACRREDVAAGKVPALTIVTIKDRQYIMASLQTASVLTAELLQKSIPALITSLEFPKTMRWGNHKMCFARPIRWILALLGEDIVPFTLEHIASGRQTYGHRQRAPESRDVASAQQYENTLLHAFVQVDQEKRRQKIVSQLQEIETAHNVTAVHKERVVSELVYLSEWPEVTTAQFSKTLLSAPKEVLISEMVEHQKYLPLVDSSSDLCNSFAFVADVPPSDIVRQGNVKVLSARLSDGSFLWKEDVKVPLSSLREKLRTIIFQRDLGSIWDKTERLATLTRSLHAYFPTADIQFALEAAQLSKADLASLVVGEFPTLQGVIGSLLATSQGLAQPIAQAIKEHWLPTQEEGPLPESPEGALLALADKFDTLTGFFAVGLRPTSSGDPYALRRQAIGISRIILHRSIHLSLRELFAKTLHLFETHQHNTALVQELESFVVSRAKILLADQGFRKEHIEAVFAKQSEDIFDASLRLQALKTLHQEQQTFAFFLEVLRRCYGQVDNKKQFVLHKDKLVAPSEKALFSELEAAEEHIHQFREKHDWEQVLRALIRLREPIDKLFLEVKVLDDDPQVQSNRLHLLQRIILLSESFVDVKKLF
jgi:glycyl-tRNA synthetase